MGHSFTKYLDYFFVLRPTLFFPVWTVFLANYRFNGSTPQPNLVLVCILITLLMGSVFIINQIKDIVTDRKNKKLFIIADGYITTRNAIIEAISLASIALAFAFYLKLEIGLIFLSIFFTTGILYNLEPFVWKDKPILGIIANFLGGLTVASAGWITAGARGWKVLIHATPYALGLVAVYFLTTLADIEGDAKAGKNTFGVKYGFRFSINLAIIFEVVTIVYSYLLNDYILFIPAIISFPFFLKASFTMQLEDILKAVKFTVLFASMAVCVKFPFYLIVLVIVYFFSKWYYRQRFNIEYPKFAA